MKRYLFLLLTFFTLHSSFFTLHAQTIGEAFYIYRNDGGFNAFFRDEVDSIAYSHYDLDSLYYDENVTQLIYTQDSLYRIPLAAIDSIGFVQPETKYKEDAVPLTGELFDYLIKDDSLTLTFNLSLPAGLTPRVGDKIVATDITDKLPCGFVGQVRQISTAVDGIKVECDSIGLESVVSQFYAVYDIQVGNGGQYRVRGPRRALHETSFDYDLPSGRTHLPPIGIGGFITEKNSFDITAKNAFDITFTPQIHLKVTRVVDDFLLRSHTNLLVVTDVDVEMGLEVAGEASKDWKKSFLPKQDFMIPPGIPFYFDIGVRASLSGEIAVGFNIDSRIHQVTDITYFDVSNLPMVGPFISPIVNRVDGDVNVVVNDITWDYLGFRAEFKPCVYLRVGIPAISHVAGWVGGDFDGGITFNGELMFDYKRLREAEPGTAVYDELKDLAKIDIKPYVGAHFMAAVFDDRYSFRLGKDFDTPLGTWYQGRILPGFSDTKATPLSDTRAKVTANITNDCFIPYTVGFALYDSDKKHVKTQIYDQKYWTRNAFSTYSCEFDDLDKTKKYKVYPVIRFFGKHDMLASPSADLDMNFPVTLSDFKVTDKQHKEKGFTHEGRQYDYCFNVSVTAKLDDDAVGIADWGYVYLDPNGREAFISLKQFGRAYTDTRWAYYRNGTPPFTCTLYGYVKYVDSDEPMYGEPHDYPLEYGETSCPDANHPHWIDLGIGTLWRCCNEGASTPEQYGGYYTFDEAQAYNPPSLYQIKALLNNCSYTWTTQNGVYGGKFTGPNGGTIFLPAAGVRWGGEVNVVGSSGYYWSSWPDGAYGGYNLDFASGGAYWNVNGVPLRGQSVRPVR